MKLKKSIVIFVFFYKNFTKLTTKSHHNNTEVTFKTANILFIYLFILAVNRHYQSNQYKNVLIQLNTNSHEHREKCEFGNVVL